MRVFILTEGGFNIGFGHITRCTSLYQAFEERGITPELIVNGDESVRDIVKGKKYKIFNWLKDEERLFALITGADMMIIDSYLVDDGFYQKASELVKIPVYIDDYNKRNYPSGIVINSLINANKSDYPQKEGIRYLLGSEYVLLRKEFWDVPEKEIREGMENVMVTFGGDDMRDMTPKVLRLLIENYPELSKNVVLGNGFQNIIEIERILDKKTNLIYSPDAKGMKKIMLESDIAICGGGQTLYELARVGVPAVAVAVADNQMYNVKGWQEAGFIEYAGWWEDDAVIENIDRSIERLRDSKIRKNRYRTGKNFIDGKGALFTVNYLLDLERNR